MYMCICIFHIRRNQCNREFQVVAHRTLQLITSKRRYNYEFALRFVELNQISETSFVRNLTTELNFSTISIFHSLDLAVKFTGSIAVFIMNKYK